MISEIEFSEVAKSTTFAYAVNLDFFKQNKSVQLKPGLNILFGPNGCGKSTILRMAALALAAEQGGVSTITSSWLNDIADFGGKSKLTGTNVLHDGQPVMYCNPRNAVGLIGGGAAFDDDFFSQGLAAIRSKDSTGLTTISRLGRMLTVALGQPGFPEKVDDRIKRRSDRYDLALKLLKARIPKGQRTLIFDEPESGLAIPAQSKLFNLLYAAAIKHDFQILLASHSSFALGLPGVNYIEMAPDYIEHSRNAIGSVYLRFQLEELADEHLKKKETAKANPSAGNDAAAPADQGKPARKRKPVAKPGNEPAPPAAADAAKPVRKRKAATPKAT